MSDDTRAEKTPAPRRTFYVVQEQIGTGDPHIYDEFTDKVRAQNYVSKVQNNPNIKVVKEIRK